MTEGFRARGREGPPARELRRLASMYGLQTSFTDTEKQRRRASADALAGVLWAMGVPARTATEVRDSLREREVQTWTRPLEPVAVAWEGTAAMLDVRLPARFARSRLFGRIELEDGDVVPFDAPGRVEETGEVDGRRFVRVRIELPEVPPGYHRVSLQRPGREATALLVSAPTSCPTPDVRLWGTFLPLYALRSRRSWGTGDFTDLGELLGWTRSLGGTTVGTLPLLASFLDQDDPFEPSPYSPASRLFWNELYVDVERVPELERSPEARALIESPEYRRKIARARALDLVDYRLVAEVKRRVLEMLAQEFFARSSGQRLIEFEAFAWRSDVFDYAAFRALGEHYRRPWQEWPSPYRDRQLTGFEDTAPARYHQYVQFVADEQLAAAAAVGREGPGTGLYLDMPLGVHPASYDTWRERDAFAREASGGAPPDSFFGGGQNWGFLPLHPERIREQEYRYPIACIRHLLRMAGVLRLDHVMGLHRLYWVPYGLDATQGVYVKYPAEELYAVLALEATRADALIVGEDLGTVPPVVRSSMTRHGVQRMHVLELEAADPDDALPVPPRGSVASLNTHDLWPFASFWTGADIDEGETQGMPKDAAREARAYRAEVRRAMTRALRAAGFLPRSGGRPADVPPEEALRACLAFLAASPARLVVANLEDLWHETRPQNHPGTWRERPNWRQKAALDFEAFRTRRGVVGTLREMDELRRPAAGGAPTSVNK